MSDRRSVGVVARAASAGPCAPVHAQNANQSSTLPEIRVDTKRPVKKPERPANGTPAAATPATAPGPPPAPDVARRLQQECLRRGLIVEFGGRSGSVARFLPPLIVSLSEIDEIAGRFGEAIKAAETCHAHSPRPSAPRRALAAADSKGDRHGLGRRRERDLQGGHQ